MNTAKYQIIGAVLAVVLIISGCFATTKIYRPTPKTDEPFTIVCTVGGKQESFAAVDYSIENGTCVFVTDDGHKIIASDYIIFIDEPYYKD